MDPISFFGGDEGPQRKPNRKERRASAKRRKKMIKEIERRAKRRFEKLKKAQDAETSPEVAEEYGFG